MALAPGFDPEAMDRGRSGTAMNGHDLSLIYRLSSRTRLLEHDEGKRPRVLTHKQARESMPSRGLEVALENTRQGVGNNVGELEPGMEM